MYDITCKLRASNLFSVFSLSLVITVSVIHVSVCFASLLQFSVVSHKCLFMWMLLTHLIGLSCGMLPVSVVYCLSCFEVGLNKDHRYTMKGQVWIWIEIHSFIKFSFIPNNIFACINWRGFFSWPPVRSTVIWLPAFTFKAPLQE